MAVSPSNTGSPPPPPAPAAQPALKSNKYAPPVLAIGVIALCLIIIGSMGIMVVYPQINAYIHWRKAQQAIDYFDLPLAQEHLKKCLQVWKSSGETEFLMARTCRRADDLDAARDHLKKAKALNWVDQQIQLEYLLIQGQTVLLPWVEERLKGLLKEGHQDDRYILEALTLGCLKWNFYKKAYQWATVWVEQHPDDWEGNFYYAQVLQAGLRYELAAEQYEKALELNPYFPEIHLHLAQVYLLDGRFQEALPHFQEYLKHDANDRTALLGLARCLRSDAKPEEARAMLEKLFAVRPEDVGGFLLEAQLALEEDNYKGAQEWLRKGLRVDPHDRLTNQNMATALRHEAAALRGENRRAEADEKETEAKEFEERNQEINKAYMRVEDISRELLEKPDDVILRTEAGTTLMKIGQNQEAFHWLISALLLNNNHKPARDSLKECLRKKGDRKLLESYRSILEDQGNASPTNRP
jgi:tetratricopeptide (TPR) repeat protein